MLSSIFADAAVSTPGGQADNGLFQLNSSWPSTESQGLAGTSQQPIAMDTRNYMVDNGNSIPANLARYPDANHSVYSQSETPNDNGDGLQPLYHPRNPFGNTTNHDSPAVSTTGSQASASLRLVTPWMVYNSVQQPYDYTEGYHYLMRYLAKNFDQQDALKVVKSLAAFRPSLIALQ